MKLYHGSNQEIEKIDLRKSRPNKDFGQGFYLTEDKAQALRMAQQKVQQHGGIAVVNAYEFDEGLLHGGKLKVKVFEGYTEEWARFIIANRDRRSQQTHDFDIVIGAIADDQVGLQLFRYMKHFIDLPTLVANLKFVRLTTQYYFGTEYAIRFLKKVQL